MKCCKCLTGTLLPTRVDSGPACHLCNNCQGILLSVGPYLDWVKSIKGQTTTLPSDGFSPEPEDTKGAVSCPKCSRIMLRYYASAHRTHGLDYCFHCDEVWLDPGEWQFLVSKGLHTQITTISTDAYQRRLREDAGREAARQRVRAAIGDAAFEEAERFKTWLATQPAKAQILRHLASDN